MFLGHQTDEGYLLGSNCGNKAIVKFLPPLDVGESISARGENMITSRRE